MAVCLHILLPLTQTHGLDGYFQKVSYTYIVSYEFVEFIYFRHLRQTNLSFSGHQSKEKLVDLRFTSRQQSQETTSFPIPYCRFELNDYSEKTFHGGAVDIF